MEPQPYANNELHNFLEFLFEGIEGVAYVATKNPTNPSDWGQYFFDYPSEAARMEEIIPQLSATSEVYLAPALFSVRHPVKENVMVSNVVWTDFDGNAPAPEDYDHVPSMRVSSSIPGHEHVYWKLSTPIRDYLQLEEINKNITYAFSADQSAWDANQCLRPPETFNHKRNAPVSIASVVDNVYDVSIFNSLPAAPASITADDWEPSALPDVAHVILKYAFPTDIIKLFTTFKLPVGERSTGLMKLAYACCEMGMTDPEIFSVIYNADDRWGKFKGRKDQNTQLARIISVARTKHPEESSDSDDFVFAFDFVQFLNTDIEIDWVVEPMLMENGSMLLVGPSGIGKTQITLQFAIHLALGKDFLHYKINRARKILFMSLEMGHGELKIFLESMAKILSPEDLLLLQQNFFVVPYGEKLALNTIVGQAMLVKLIESIQPEGIFVDSIGSAMVGSISDDESAQALLDFNDKIRKKYNLFTWYIHHMRKSTNGGKAPTSQDDVYGNQYFVNRSTSVYGALHGRDGLIKFRAFKTRLSAKEEDFYVKRMENYTFEEVNHEVNKKLTEITYKKPEDEKGPIKQPGQFQL